MCRSHSNQTFNIKALRTENYKIITTHLLLNLLIIFLTKRVSSVNSKLNGDVTLLLDVCCSTKVKTETKN